MSGTLNSHARPLMVAHVIHHLVIGGMENGVVNLINRLPPQRFRHAVICIEDYSDFAQRIQRPDVEVIALKRSHIGAWRLRLQLLAQFRRLRPDIVHTRNLSGLDALLPARLLGLRTVHSEHGFDVDNLKGGARKPTLLRRLHQPLVQQYICVSRDLRRLMVEGWHIPSGRVKQIYNGVDTTRFVPPPSPRRDVLPPDLASRPIFVVGTVGRVRPIKDQLTLVRAIGRVATHRPELRAALRCVVVGDGPQLPEAQALAAQLGISDLCWFPGARRDIPELMQAFDLFVLPSLNEGISNTVLEAMATGLPLLVTAVGGNVELVDESIGDLFAPGDVDRLAELIETHATSPDLCARRGTAARHRAMAAFSIEAMLSSYQQVYESVVNR